MAYRTVIKPKIDYATETITKYIPKYKAKVEIMKYRLAKALFKIRCNISKTSVLNLFDNNTEFEHLYKL